MTCCLIELYWLRELCIRLYSLFWLTDGCGLHSYNIPCVDYESILTKLQNCTSNKIIPFQTTWNDYQVTFVWNFDRSIAMCLCPHTEAGCLLFSGIWILSTIHSVTKKYSLNIWHLLDANKMLKINAICISKSDNIWRSVLDLIIHTRKRKNRIYGKLKCEVLMST